MKNDGWKLAKADIFWGDIAFYDHILQVYETDEIFAEAFAGFISSGIHIGDCCVVVATETHLAAINNLLETWEVNTVEAMADGRYIQVNVEELLSKFMVDDQVDEKLFQQAMNPLFEKCRNTKRVIRACGEVAPTLAGRGNWAAATRVEQLWEELHHKEKFSLFCAYSKNVFGKGTKAKVNHICAQHSKMIAGNEKQSTEIYYCDEVIA